MLHRPASRDDLRAVVELFRAADVAYRGGVDTDDSDLTDDWDVPGFDFAASTLVGPVGLVVRDDDRPRDDVDVHALIRSSFREIGGQYERTLASWSTHLLDSPTFDPSLYLVAETGGAVVGAALTRDVGEYGYVRQLAVSPAQRGRGLGLALLHEGVRRHAALGRQARS